MGFAAAPRVQSPSDAHQAVVVASHVEGELPHKGKVTAMQKMLMAEAALRKRQSATQDAQPGDRPPRLEVENHDNTTASESGQDRESSFLPTQKKTGLLGRIFRQNHGNHHTGYHRKNTHSSTWLDETSPPFEVAPDKPRRRSLFATPATENQHAPNTVVRGLNLQLGDVMCQLQLLLRTMGEFLATVVLLALFFTLMLQGVDTHHVDGKDANVLACFMVMVSLLMTSTDDWAPGRLHLDSYTYVVIMASLRLVHNGLCR
jgi:hypothetical protein